MDHQQVRFGKACPGLYFGNTAAGGNPNILTNNDISVVIYFGKKPQTNLDIKFFNYVVPSGEIMDSELPKTNIKLDAIIKDLTVLRDNGNNILICCEEGRRQSMLIAGYYMIGNGTKYDSVATLFETVYFTQQQRVEDTQPMPQHKEYMSAEGQNKYTAKFKEYELEKIKNPYLMPPQPTDFMNATERDLYDKKHKEYETKKAERQALRGLPNNSFKKILRMKGGAKK